MLCIGKLHMFIVGAYVTDDIVNGTVGQLHFIRIVRGVFYGCAKTHSQKMVYGALSRVTDISWLYLTNKATTTAPTTESKALIWP